MRATSFKHSGIKTLFFVLLPVLMAAAADRETKKSKAKSGELFEAVARVDRHLFDAFNAHKVDRLMSIVTKDAEFYQDNDGVKNYQESFAEFKTIFESNTDIRRELVDGTLEVYPIKDYGALEIGQHRICHTEKGKKNCSVFKFVMIWQKTDDSWKLSRVISYRH